MNPEFIAYAEGRETGARLAKGAFDISGTGSTPPILAKASGLPVIYAAASAPRPTNGAILISKTSKIRSVADLKGKPVALVDGSFLSYLLAKQLEEIGLRLTDTIRRDMPPGESLAALRENTVAAWVAMTPHLEQVLVSGEFTVLARCGTLIPNRSTFWTIEDRRLSSTILQDFTAELKRLGNEIASDPEKAAELLSTSGDEAERRAWTRVVSERNWQVDAADHLLLREQQEEADTLFHHGDLNTKLTIYPADEGDF